MASRQRRSPLWTCPKCGHAFVTRNLWHSCSRHTLDEHFRCKDPRLRKLFDAYVALVRRCGPITVYAQKTRIVIMNRVRFTGAIVRKDHLQSGFYLHHRLDHPRFERIEKLAPRAYLHRFRLRTLSDLDRELLELVRVAYRVGTQQDLDAPRIRRRMSRRPRARAARGTRRLPS